MGSEAAGEATAGDMAAGVTCRWLRRQAGRLLPRRAHPAAPAHVVRAPGPLLPPPSADAGCGSAPRRYTLCASGTGHSGMEMCIANLLEPGEKIVVGNNGIWVSGAALRQRCAGPVKEQACRGARAAVQVVHGGGQGDPAAGPCWLSS